MRYLQQNLGNGKISLEESTVPELRSGQVLIKTSKSLISTGTERMLLEFGKSNIFSKIKNNQDKINLLFDKIKTSGFFSTMEIVQDKLFKPIQIGYSNVGIVQKSLSKKFKKGDRVVSNGFHSEYVKINENLCCKIPNEVKDDNAVFSILGSIALNGIRKIKPQINENIIIYGFGLIGIIAAKILHNTGANIIVVDIDEKKRKLAEELGHIFINPNNEDLEQKIDIFTNKLGADSILICTYTVSSEPLKNSSKIIRKLGTIVLIGSCDLNISRKLMYEKEAIFQISKSYGPGRYDYSYEQKNMDYPAEHVRWTLNRNLESVLNLIKQKKLDFTDLINYEFDLESFDRAYKKVLEEKSLKAILLSYNLDKVDVKKNDVIKILTSTKLTNDSKSLFCLGAGNQCKNILLPLFKKNKITFEKIYSSKPLDTNQLKNKFGFNKVCNNEDEIFTEKDGFVLIATPHNVHSEQILKAVKNKKNVFVEKPLAINDVQLENLEEEIKNDQYLPLIFCNFNRRYSPLSRIIKESLNKNIPKRILIDINSPSYGDGTSWISDEEVSGGPIIGESCHFIDLAKYFVDRPISSYDIKCNKVSEDYTIFLEFDDSSTALINYMFGGTKKYPKENIKIFSGGTVSIIDDFIKINQFGKSKLSKKLLLGQDKGHENSVKTFIDLLKNKKNNINQVLDYIDTTKIALKLKENC